MHTHKHATVPEARNTLQHLLRFYPLATLTDQLASICAEHATEVEPLDGELATRWDRACGKLAVVANQLTV